MVPLPVGPGQKVRVGVYSMVGLQETGEVGPFESRSIDTVAKELLDYVQDNVVPEFEQFFV